MKISLYISVQSDNEPNHQITVVFCNFFLFLCALHSLILGEFVSFPIVSCFLTANVILFKCWLGIGLTFWSVNFVSYIERFYHIMWDNTCTLTPCYVLSLLCSLCSWHGSWPAVCADDGHSDSGSSYINIQPCKFVRMHLHASVCIHLGEGMRSVWVCVLLVVVEGGLRGATFRGFAVIIWQNAGESLRVLSRGSRVRGPSTLGRVICKCHSGGVLCQPTGRGGGRGEVGEQTGEQGRSCSGLFSCRLFHNRCWVPLLPLSAAMALDFLICAKHIVWHIACSVMCLSPKQ